MLDLRSVSQMTVIAMAGGQSVTVLTLMKRKCNGQKTVAGNLMLARAGYEFSPARGRMIFREKPAMIYSSLSHGCVCSLHLNLN